MFITDKNLIPQDYYFFRSSSYLCKEVVLKHWYKVLERGKEFGRWKNILPKIFCVANFDRVRFEPTVQMMKDAWFWHGFMLWSPVHTMDKPKWWKKFWYPSFCDTGFVELNDAEYFKRWKDRAKRARIKFLNNPDLKIRMAVPEDFQKAFCSVKFDYPFKREVFRSHEKYSKTHPEALRNFLCFHNGICIGWLAVLDYNPTQSMHFIAFLGEEGKKLHAGTGLIDYWFKDSLERGFKYIDFDHLKDKRMDKSHKWYNDFKENFLDYRISFDEVYFKLF